MAKKKTQTASRNTELKPVDLAFLAEQQVQLSDLRLLNCHCVMPTAGKDNTIPELKQSIAINNGKSDEHVAIIVQIIFSLAGDFADGREGLRINARFGLTYKIKSIKDITDEQVKIVGQTLGLNNAWPYWREFVQSTIGRMGLPPLLLPLINPNQMIFTKNEKQRKSIVLKKRKNKEKK
jgi:preprotein translocase subunit SecB